MDTLSEGDIVTREGRVVGTHRGVARYTIGQRRGLGVSLGYPVFVVGIDAAKNRVVVGPAEELESHVAELRDVRWPEGLGSEFRALVQLRSHHAPGWARIERGEERRARVRFDDPQRAITPGQSAVFYDGDAVLGGGIVADAGFPSDEAVPVASEG